jgi:hypothetical protein
MAVTVLHIITYFQGCGKKSKRREEIHDGG